MRDSARSLGVVRHSYVDEAVAAGSLSNLSLVIWRGEKTAERAASERRSLMALTARHPGDSFALFVIKASTPPLNEAMRQASAEMVRAAQHDLRAAAVVIEGSGFTAAVTRAVLTALELLTGGHSFPSKYFSDLDEAARWLLAQGAQGSLQGVLDAVRTLESAPLEESAARAARV